MGCTIQNWALVCAALLVSAGGALAGERAGVNRRTGLYEPPLADLRKADERGDRAELARAAARLGPARLGKALQDPDPRIVLAALDGIPLVAPGILLLGSVVPLTTSADETTREHAVRALATLLGASDLERLAEWEIPAETAQAACRGLGAAVANESEQLATRLLAAQGLADAAAVCAGGLSPAQLLSSREPEIRRAAVLLLDVAPAPADFLVSAAKDRDGRVAAAAGARLCKRRAKSPALPGEPPLRQLALAQGASPEDVIEILPCLANSKDPADGKALDDLKSGGAASVREAAGLLRDKAR
jgi:hypothetical protein